MDPPARLDRPQSGIINLVGRSMFESPRYRCEIFILCLNFIFKMSPKFWCAYCPNFSNYNALGGQQVFMFPRTLVKIVQIREYSVSQIHSPWLGDKVDYGLGLSYRPARLHRLAGRYHNPMTESTLSPQSRTMNLATDFSRSWRVRVMRRFG